MEINKFKKFIKVGLIIEDAVLFGVYTPNIYFTITIVIYYSFYECNNDERS